MLMSVPGLALELDRRNRRRTGASVMRIRRVDIRTGGPITLRAALIQNLVSQGSSVAWSKVTRPLTKRSKSRLAEIRPELDELERVHADDPVARQEATMRLYEDHKVNPSASCLATLLSIFVFRTLPVLLSPLRQSLPDRVAGIVVVLDDSRGSCVNPVRRSAS